MVEEAIRNGTWLPNPDMGRRRGRRPIGEKPKLWDIYMRQANIEKDTSAKGKDKESEASGFDIEGENVIPAWDSLMVSAIILLPQKHLVNSELLACFCAVPQPRVFRQL